MGYDYKVKNYYKVKKDGYYSAPCPADEKAVWELYTDDILTKNPDGTFVCQTGICRTGIILKDDEVIFFEKETTLRLM
jgi:hypothetical protein